MLCDHPPACPPSCDHCLAYDRHTRSLCSALPASPGSKWCAIHEELQAKLLKSYKRLTLAADLFNDALLPRDFAAVSSEEDLGQLRSWSEAARKKYGLNMRVVVARAEHHNQFYGGGDRGHCIFVETLVIESDRLERLMRALDQRAYSISLVKSQAEWILAPTKSFVCHEPVGPPTPPPTPPLSPQTLPTKHARKKASRKKPITSATTPEVDIDFDQFCCPEEEKLDRHLTTASQLNQLRSYLIAPTDLPSTIRASTWHALVSILFRFAILRIPSLAPLALSPDRVDTTVASFLDLLEERTETHCGDEVGRLWRALKFSRGTTSTEEGLLGVGVLGDCIADVYRGQDDDSMHVVALGGRMYKEASKVVVAIPDEGWDLFYQFIGCAGCSVSVTRTFSEYSRNRRLALLGAYPAWLTPSESLTEHTFRLGDVVLCGSNLPTCGKKVKRVGKTKRGGTSKVVLVEEWERAWMYVKLPLDALSSTKLLETLTTSTQLVIVARNGETLESTHRPTQLIAPCKTRGCTCCSTSDLWLGRVRSGLSPAERKAAKWTTATFFPGETILESFSGSSSPESRFDHKYTDVTDVLIMDNRDYDAPGDWSSFARLVSTAILDSQSCESLSTLLIKERIRAIAKGEMCEPTDDGRVEISSKKGGKGISYSLFEEKFTIRSLFREV